MTIDYQTLRFAGPFQRGTKQWEDREYARQAAGCRLLSFGEIPASEVSCRVDVRDVRRGLRD